MVTASERKQRRFSNWQLGLFAAVLLLLVVFIAENFNTVEVRVIVVRREMRLAYALLLAATLGFIVGWIASRLRARG